MIRALALGCACLAPLGAAADGFCFDNLNQLPLKASMMHPEAIYVQQDPGYAQILCLDCGPFRQIEFFLGVDGDDTETVLRSTASAAAAIEDVCDRGVAACSANLITTPSSIGLRKSYITGAFSQSAISLNTAGERLTVRVTANTDDITWTQNTVDRVFTALLPSLGTPC